MTDHYWLHEFLAFWLFLFLLLILNLTLIGTVDVTLRLLGFQPLFWNSPDELRQFAAGENRYRKARVNASDNYLFDKGAIQFGGLLNDIMLAGGVFIISIMLVGGVLMIVVMLFGAVLMIVGMLLGAVHMVVQAVGESALLHAVLASLFVWYIPELSSIYPNSTLLLSFAMTFWNPTPWRFFYDGPLDSTTAAPVMTALWGIVWSYALACRVHMWLEPLHTAGWLDKLDWALFIVAKTATQWSFFSRAFLIMYVIHENEKDESQRSIRNTSISIIILLLVVILPFNMFISARFGDLRPRRRR